MAITVTHTKVSLKPDEADESLIRPSDWNATHALSGTVPVANGGTGAATLTGYVYGNGTSAMTASTTVPSTAITGLGTMSTQNANAIAVTGGSMSGVTISDYIPTTQKAAALGVATLDSATKVPISQIPDSVIGALSYQGTWNASTNTPTLASSTGTKGYYYVVSVAGSTNLNGVTDWQIGDWAVYNGSVWQKIDNTDSVTSVNGFTGAVVLTNTDISGFGTMSTQNANAVAVTGGTINGTTIGATTASSGAFTNVSTSSTTSTTPVLSYNASNSNLALGGTVSGSYLQAVMQNKSATAGASTNFAVSNNLGTDSTYYGEFGMNSSVFSASTPADYFSINNGIYYSGHDGDVSIGSGNGYKTYFAWGTTGQSAHVINVTGAIGLNTNLGTTPALSGTTNFGTSGQVLTSGGSAATPTWTTPTTGTVTSVTGTSPVVSSGGNTPAISMPAATTSVSGYLTSTDWNTFNNKGSGTVTSVSATAPITSSGGATPNLAMPAATTSVSGYLTSTDWTTFNNKGSGTVTSVTGTAPVVSSGGATPAISMAAATTSVSGYLTSTDWTTFNGKQAALVSGTNIKTINGSTVLGSGDLTVTGTPAGSTTQVQYNNAGAFAGSSGFIYNTTTQRLDLGGTTGGLVTPKGTTAQRNGTAIGGEIRFNTTTNCLEVYNGFSWINLTTSVYSASYLVVAGGAGGGSNGNAGGGGAGGYLASTATLTAGVQYTITVGAGGAIATSGSNSVLSGTGITTVTSTGGGAGANSGANGTNGGSGGGGSGGGAGATTGGTGVSGQGYAGGSAPIATGPSYGGGGGGGSSAVGANGTGSSGGNGGAGTASSITGSSVTYAGGGGGGSNSGLGSGGAGGGGAGSLLTVSFSVAGSVNTGGGGGGGTSATYASGAAGGSGVVILSLPTANYTGTITGSPTVATSGSNTILTYTSSGTYTA